MATTGVAAEVFAESRGEQIVARFVEFDVLFKQRSNEGVAW